MGHRPNLTLDKLENFSKLNLEPAASCTHVTLSTQSEEARNSATSPSGLNRPRMRDKLQSEELESAHH